MGGGDITISDNCKSCDMAKEEGFYNCPECGDALHET